MDNDRIKHSYAVANKMGELGLEEKTEENFNKGGNSNEL